MALMIDICRHKPSLFVLAKNGTHSYQKFYFSIRNGLQLRYRKIGKMESLRKDLTDQHEGRGLEHYNYTPHSPQRPRIYAEW